MLHLYLFTFKVTSYLQCAYLHVCVTTQVLSHNLYTVLNIPHDPVALEEHFQDDDDGPVSNHGYMPYLNKYILDKVQLKSPIHRNVTFLYLCMFYIMMIVVKHPKLFINLPLKHL